MSLTFKPKLYKTPSTEEEASRLLKQYGERARIIAGGTGIYEVSHRGLLSDVETLIDVSRLGLDYVRKSSRGSSELLVLGSCTTMSELAGSTEILSRPELAAVVDALHAIQPIQVKNVATIGGAICTALPFFDLPVALFCLPAEVVVSPMGDTRPITDFIQGYFAVNLGAGEFVREIILQLSSNKSTASAFKKFALTGDDWAIINSAARVTIGESGNIESATISLGGGIGEKPVLANNTSSAISGMKFSDEEKLRVTIDSSIEEDIESVTDIRASSQYRMKIAKVMCRRAVLEACSRAAKEKRHDK